MRKLLLVAALTMAGFACEPSEPADPTTTTTTEPSVTTTTSVAMCLERSESILQRINNYEGLYNSIDSAREANVVIETGERLLGDGQGWNEDCATVLPAQHALIEAGLVNVSEKIDLLRHFDV